MPIVVLGVVVSCNLYIEKYLSDASLFEQVFTNVSKGLDSKGEWLEGDTIIKLETGEELGPFRIRVYFQRGYYERLSRPEFYLVSHHSEWTQSFDSHIEHDWKLCLSLEIETEINLKNPDAFGNFLERLGSFLVDASIYQGELKELGPILAKWPGKERDHDEKGFISAIAGKVESLNTLCPCGRNETFNKCHGKWVDNMISKIIDGQFNRIRIYGRLNG